LELVALGPEPGQRWRRPIPTNQVIRLGRSPEHGWSVPWDLRISREHADLQLSDGQLQIRCLDDALNPAYSQGEVSREFTLQTGEVFRIGSTSFRFDHVSEASVLVEAPLREYCYSHQEIQAFQFQNTGHCLEVLGNLSQVLTNSETDEDLAQHLVSLLLDSIPLAGAAAIVQQEQDSSPAILRLDSRDAEGSRLKPSRLLIEAAMKRGITILHLWPPAEQTQIPIGDSKDIQWAFCSPLPESAVRSWAFFISGKLDSSAATVDDLHGDLRFVQLLGELLGICRQPTIDSGSTEPLVRFFSPPKSI